MLRGQRYMNAKLILEDGTIFEGKAFGYLNDSWEK